MLYPIDLEVHPEYFYAGNSLSEDALGLSVLNRLDSCSETVS